MVDVQEYINREAPDIEARKLGLIDTAKALAEQPITLPQYQLAGFTPAQQDAFLKAQQGIGVYQPWLAQAQADMAAGQAALQGGLTGVGATTSTGDAVASADVDITVTGQSATSTAGAMIPFAFPSGVHAATSI